MKHLKKYKLFESVITKSEFPNELDIKELFYDLTDVESFSKCELYESGYKFFTTNIVSVPIRTQLFSDMSFEKNWINKECKYIQDTWKNMFIDLSKPLSDDMIKIAKTTYTDIDFSDIEKSKKTLQKHSGKSYFEKLEENILNGIIPGYPFICLYIGFFKSDKLPILIECLERLYEVTGFRPISSLWQPDMKVDIYGADLKLFKVSDIEYKNLCNLMVQNDKTTEMTKHFL